MRPSRLAALAALLAVIACGDPADPPTTVVASAPASPRQCANAPAVVGQPPGPADWPVYHRSGDRHGVDPTAQTARTAAPLWGIRLDGGLYAQPLVVQGLVIAVTEHDSVYAFDAVTGCQAWRTSLGAAFDVRQHKLKCNNIEPELGITATPAVDPVTATVYVVAFLDPGRYEMDALDLGSGAVRWRHPMDLPGSDPLQQLSRPAVALSGGRAYASFGGRAGDCGSFHGFVFGVQTDGQGPDVLFQVSPNRGGGVWAPGGPVLMPNGDLLVSTGNTDEVQRYDGSERVVRLTPNLRPLDSFAPVNWAHLNQVDFDLGSVGPTLLDSQRVFQVGKDGIGYLLDVDHLGGIGGQLYARPLSGGCYAIGTTAYRAPLVFVPCDHSLTALRVSGARFEVAWRGPDFRSGSPIVAGGLVWDYDFEGGFLWAFDPGSGVVRQKITVGTGQHFASLAASAGRLYVPAQHSLYAFAI